MSEKIKLSILMPVKDEGANLQIILKILKALVDIPHEILIVYDTLDDNSIPVVDKIKTEYPPIRGIHNRLGRGVANAIKAGVNAATADYIFVLPADDIGPILAIDDMVALMDKGCDLVSATRYSHGGRVMGGYFISRFLSRIANKLFYFISGSSLNDSTVGIKMFRKSIFDKIKLEAKPVGWVVAFEMAMRAQLAGLKLGQVPIVSINRFYGGKSSFKLGPWVKEYSKWFLLGVWKLYTSGKWRQKVSVKIPEKISLRRKK